MPALTAGYINITIDKKTFTPYESVKDLLYGGFRSDILHPRSCSMAEIKSTLDLIMEKTKGLTLSDEEKADLKRKELEKNVRGLVQRYLDSLIDKKTLHTTLDDMKHGDDATTETVLAHEFLQRLDPLNDNDRLLDIIDFFSDDSISDIRLALDHFQDACGGFKKELGDELCAQLAELGISGSALVPNADGDHRWEEWYEKERLHLIGHLRARFFPES